MYVGLLGISEVSARNKWCQEQDFEVASKGDMAVEAGAKMAEAGMVGKGEAVKAGEEKKLSPLELITEMLALMQSEMNTQARKAKEMS